jgi:MFS transporter, ACS family, hexuronate transporter
MPEPSAPVNRWVVCGLLLLATMLNYMDRQTLSQTAKRVKDQFTMDRAKWGKVDAAFGYGFATGALVVGTLADRLNVRQVYPVLVLAWSAVGFATGFTRSYEELLACRYLLGVAEAGHYPCALLTTQRLLAAPERALGNSLMHSGGALGAVLTPQIVLAAYSQWDSWRPPFWAIGALGLLWVGLWLVLVPRDALRPTTPARPSSVKEDWLRFFRTVPTDRRYWVLLVLVIAVNATWHFFRHWLPLILGEEYEYDEAAVQRFSSLYFIVADIGSLSAGSLALWLARHGWTVHRGRILVFAIGAFMTPLSLLAATLPAGLPLLAVFLAIGFASLWLFPLYYSFSQEITSRDQGKVTGSLGFLNWIALAVLQTKVGELIEEQKSYGIGVALAGLPPLVGLAALLIFWRGAGEEGRGPLRVAATQ